MLLNGHSPQVVAENIRTLMKKGHTEKTASKHAHAHAAANRAAHGMSRSGSPAPPMPAMRGNLPAQALVAPGLGPKE